MQKIFILIMAFAIISQGCGVFQRAKHEHENEVPKVQYTAYNQDFELFAEADAFVKGEVSNILCHFSVLPSFDALNEGEVTVSLFLQGSAVMQTLGSPTRKGIYSFDITPEQSGTGQLDFSINTGELKSRISITGIVVYESTNDASNAEIAQVPMTNTFVFTKEQSWKVDFETGYPVSGSFGQVIKTTAQNRPAPDDEFLVTARVNGVVSVFSDRILSGRETRKDEPLLTISGKGLAIGNLSVHYAEARNNFEKAKSDYERISELANDKIMSEKDLLEARNKYENTKVVFENLEKNFSLDGQTVKSPVDGFISQVFVHNGQYVEAGQPLIRIIQNIKMVLYAEVQQKFAPVLSKVVTANIRTLPGGNTYRLDDLRGRILSYGRNANSDNFLLPVSLLIETNGEFVSGGFSEVYLITADLKQAMSVPNTALLEEQGNYFVFVQITPELFEKRVVKTGATEGINTEIIEGIGFQDRIVTKGAIYIKLAQATGTLDAQSGHVH
ncbi:MAG: efflux RND transporter periplasmic adaptor subunit [Bacteroidales bacterium]|nr:efflux RND transporter periplasmic adaptor subunit [Bacteroidales bacterium]